MMPAFRPLLGAILRGHFWPLVVGLVVPIVAMLLGLLVDRLGDTLDHSVWEYAGQPARWMLFVIGFVITPMVLPAYVAHGVTRRTVTAAAGTAGALLSLAIAGYLAIGLLVERAIFDATGRQHTVWLVPSFLVIMLVYGGIVVVATTWGSPQTSIWASAGWVLQWLGFAIGIALASCLPVLVAFGVTRQRLALAVTAAALILATGMAALVQVGLVLELVAFRAGGLEYAVGGDHLFTGVGQVHLVLAEFGTLFAGFLATGTLVWTGYYRFGWRLGTLAAPLGFVPAVGVLAAQTAGYAGPVDGDSPAWIATIGAPVAVTMALLAVVAGLSGFRVITRAMAVK